MEEQTRNSELNESKRLQGSASECVVNSTALHSTAAGNWSARMKERFAYKYLIAERLMDYFVLRLHTM
jgi:hypothetical protein